MTVSIASITFDSADPEPLARWWAERFDAEITANMDGFFVIVAGGSLPTQLAFQRVDDPTPGKNRIHVDFSAADLGAEVDRLVSLGATETGRHEYGTDFRWVVLADPEGNAFCVAGS